MIDLSNCIELGTIVKCHGIRGQVVLKINNLNFDDIKELEPVFIEIDGLPVPFFVSEYTERSKETLVLSIDDLDREETARELINCRVFIKSSQVQLPEDLIIESNLIVGYTVIDKRLGKLGVVDKILDFDKNPLLRIPYNKKEILLPFHEEFIREINTADKIIHVVAPEGLLNIS